MNKAVELFLLKWKSERWFSITNSQWQMCKTTNKNINAVGALRNLFPFQLMKEKRARFLSYILIN